MKSQLDSEMLTRNAAWRFVVNPAAGGGKVGRRWLELEKKLRAAGVDFDAVFTEKKFHAAELAAQAIAEGCRRLVAVGGDGTAHEVVNGIFRQNHCPPGEVTFALLPVGTGNDWIRTHRIPKNFDRWLHVLRQEKTARQDVGWLTYFKNGEPQKRFFMNVAGFSYDGFVAKKAEAHGAWVSNKLFYLYLIFRCLFQFRPPKARVVFDLTNRPVSTSSANRPLLASKIVERKFYTINAGICRYSGGGIQLVPHAQPADGKLALTLVNQVSKLEVLLVTPLFYSGKIGWHPAVSFFQTGEIFIETLESQPILAEADGEFLGEAPVRMGLCEERLRFLVP